MTDESGQENRDAPSNEDKPSRRRLIGFAIAGALLLAVLLWVWVDPSDPTEKKDFIQAVGVLLAALAGLSGLYFTSQNLKQTRQNTEKQLQQARDSTKDQLQQARESQEQNQRLIEQGQITERFTRAIDQLGKVDEKNNKLFEIRLGGIYALERIARESEEDHWPIMEVLTAYVRQHAPWRQEEEREEELQRVEEDTTPEKSEQNSSGESKTLEAAAADIQAIITVLRRRIPPSVMWSPRDSIYAVRTSRERTSGKRTSRTPTSRERTSRARTSRERPSWKRPSRERCSRERTSRKRTFRERCSGERTFRERCSGERTSRE